jgi:hypothetical protein
MASQGWFYKQNNGRTKGPVTTDIVAQLLELKEINRSTLIWSGHGDWHMVSDVPEFQKKECPFCLSLIPELSKKCRHCGEWLNSTSANTSVQSQEIAKNNTYDNNGINSEYPPRPKSIFETPAHNIPTQNASTNEKRLGRHKGWVTGSIIFTILTLEEFAGCVYKNATYSDGMPQQLAEQFWKDEHPYYNTILTIIVIIFAILALVCWKNSDRDTGVREL